MSQQSVSDVARRSALEAQAVRRKERADRKRRHQWSFAFSATAA